MILSALAAAYACGAPTRPSFSVVSGQPASPVRDATVSYYQQPISLTATTGVTTGGETATNVVELASESGFGVILMSRSVSAAPGTSASVTLDHLDASTTYYWRVKTSAGREPPIVSATSSFSVGPRLIIQAPVLLQPGAGAWLQPRPTFSVANAQRSGPPSGLAYRFEISTTSEFASLVIAESVPETDELTSFTPIADLTPGSTYFVRVRATDGPTGEVSDYSATRTFRVANPADGSWRYEFAMRTPAASATCSLRLAPDYRWSRYPADLVVNAGTLSFTLQTRDATRDHSLSTFQVQLNRQEDRLTGTLGGLLPPKDVYDSNAVRIGARKSGMIVEGVAIATGTADDNGRLSGRFDGHVSDDNPPYEVGPGCASSAFEWSVVPIQ